jgi:hypothetical protein
MAARGRKRPNHVAVQHLLPPRGLHVHDRRLSGNGYRFCERTNAHLDVNRGNAAACEVHAFAHDCGERGQRVCQRIGPGRQIIDPVLAGTVGGR